MARPSSTLPSDAARVRVPASTSNLGPGFDVLGLALELWLEVRVERATEHADVRLGTCAGSALDWPTGPQNLLLRACEHAYRELGGSGGLRLSADSLIPVGRGLGSSGAAVVAGLLAGAALAPRSVAREQILAWAIDIEGHPDNVTPALFGGCQLTCPRPGAAPRAVALEVHPELGFAIAWPERALETAFARSLLPRQVALTDAVDSARRLALVIEGLRRGDPELLAAGNVEHLRVPHRLAHIPAGAQALAAAREAGASLATISGAGSALFAISALERAPEVARAMGAVFAAAAAGGEAHAVRPVLTATLVHQPPPR